MRLDSVCDATSFNSHEGIDEENDEWDLEEDEWGLN